MTDTLQIVVVVGVSIGAVAMLFRQQDDMAQHVTVCVAIGLIAALVFLGAAGWI